MNNEELTVVLSMLEGDPISRLPSSSAHSNNSSNPYTPCCFNSSSLVKNSLNASNLFALPIFVFTNVSKEIVLSFVNCIL